MKWLDLPLSWPPNKSLSKKFHLDLEFLECVGVVMNHTFLPCTLGNPTPNFDFGITFESISIFRFNFESLPNLRNCQDIPDRSAPSCGLSCRFSRVTSLRGIQDYHTYMHFNGPKHNTSIDRSTNQSDDVTADLAHSW